MVDVSIHCLVGVLNPMEITLDVNKDLASEIFITVSLVMLKTV
jgi:hypothetical protein